MYVHTSLGEGLVRCRKGCVARKMLVAGLLLVVCVVRGALGQVTSEVQEWTEVSNPCSQFRCPVGSVCVPVVNDLLQLPVAHCVEKPTADEGADVCFNYEVGVSIVTCKTEAEWREVATSRCSIGQQQASSVKATISCCSQEASALSITAATTTEATSGSTGHSHIGGEGFREQWHEEEEEEEEKGEGGEKESVTVDVIVGLSGGILLLVVALVTIKILHYRRTKRPPYKPRLSFVTSFINPNSEGWKEEGSRERTGEAKVDFSYVITNDSCDTSSD